MYGLSLPLTLLGVLILLSRPVVTSKAAWHDNAGYTVEKAHIALGRSSCIPSFVYTPVQPLTEPPGAVVMVPALGQNALHEGLHNYAHTFASNGLSVILLSAPASLRTNSDHAKARQFLLHCNHHHQQQHQWWQVSGTMQQPRGLFGSTSKSYRKAVTAYIQQLAKDGKVDGSRLAYWGAEWGAVAAVQTALESDGLDVQTVLLQTPYLGATRTQTWQRLQETSTNGLQLVKSLSLAAVDWLAGLTQLPDKFRLAGVPLSGLPGSGALLELQQHELDLHLAVAGSSEGNTTSIPKGALLDILLHPNPIHNLLPQLQIPVAFYAAEGDSDTSVQQYISASKTAKYVSFHLSPRSRYSLLSGEEQVSEQLDDVLRDQTMLLIALLGDVNLVKSRGIKGQQQQQQQKPSAEQKQCKTKVSIDPGEVSGTALPLAADPVIATS